MESRKPITSNDKVERLHKMQFAIRNAVVVLCVAVGCTATLFAQSTAKPLGPEQRRVVASVETMFRAAARNDPKMFDSVTTAGFYLFDAGSRFNGNSILAVIQRLKASGKRFEWNVMEADVHIDGNSAWIAYVDRGSMIQATGITKMEWLESAFLSKQAGQWKLAFMQSTPVASAGPRK